MNNHVIEQLLEQGAQRHNGEIRLESDREYYVDLGRDASSEWVSSPLLRRLGASSTYALNLVNRIGRLRLGPLHLHVVSAKLADDEFRRLVSQVAQYVSSLPFSHRGAVAPYALTRQRNVTATRYHIVVQVSNLLRSGRLQATVRRIVADPHVVFTSERNTMRIERARRVDGTTVRLLCAAPRHFDVLAPGAAAGETTLAGRLQSTALANHFPREVSSKRMIRLLDNPENQFVRHALEWMLREVSALGNDPRCPADVSAEARYICLELERLLGHDLFRHVSRPRYIHLASQVLQRRAGYRDLLQYYSQLSLPPTPSWPDDMQQILELKDAALLYEYWVFVTICRIIEELTERNPSSADADGINGKLPVRNRATTLRDVRRGPFEHTIPGGLRVRFPGGVTVKYNAGLMGYSGPFRPDITVETYAGMWVFDAKFRAQWAVNSEGDELGNPPEARSDDIHKMHTYRDALNGCRGAYVVYPGEETQMYSALGTKVQPGAAALDGVGTVPAVPNRESAELRSVLQALLQGQ